MKRREEIEKYLAACRGGKTYAADEGGEVPDDDDATEATEATEDDSDEPDDATKATEASASAKDEAEDASDDAPDDSETPADEAPQSKSDAVAEAVARQRRLQNISNFGNALESIATARGRALGVSGDDSNYWKGIGDQGTQGVQMAQAARNAELSRDAKRAIIDQQIKARKDLSDERNAAQAERTRQHDEDLAESKRQHDQTIAAARKAATDAAAARLADAKAARDAGVSDKKDMANERQLDKDEKEMGAALDPNKARAGLSGENQKKLNSAARASALIYETNPDGSVIKDQNGQPLLKDLNNTMMGEAAASWANMIQPGGGSQADAAVERLLPHTSSGQLANVAEWITNEPHGAGQQAFLKQMAESIKRETGVSETLLKQAQAQSASRYSKLKRERPESWDANLVAAGVDPGDIDPQGRHNPGWKEKSRQMPAVSTAPPSAPPPPGGLPPLTAIDEEIAKRKAAAAAKTAGTK